MPKKTELMAVEAKDLQVIEYRGQRVVTTEQLAAGYCTDTRNIKVNYSRNTDRFVEGKHFFKVAGRELADLRVSLSNLQISSKARSLMLWTERGAANHAKMLETDQAWRYHDDLSEFYFTQREALLSTPAIPDLSRLDILQMAIESEKGRLAEKNRADEAERTKALIGSRREATAMARASAAVRERNKLADRLGESQKHATVKAVERFTGIEYSWRPLRKWCQVNGNNPVNVPDPRFGQVKAWPREAWLAVHCVELRDIQVN